MNHLNEILTPVPGDKPCGRDLSYSKEFDDIAEIRREDELLPQGEWVTSRKTAEWDKAEKKCTDLLVKTSKDLRLAVWLTEACTFNHGYKGMQYGLEVCTQLCTSYWEGLYPQPEDGDMDERSGNIRWLIRRLVELIRMVPITSGEHGAYSLFQMDQAGASQDELTQFNQALRATPKPELLQSFHDLAACKIALAAWQTQIDEYLGNNDGPSFVAAREALNTALHDVERLAREVGALTSHKTVSDSGSNHAASAAGQKMSRNAATPRETGPLRSREQALIQLREVAHFFRVTEPHSPVAYLADKAAHWGEMALHDWLRAVVKEGTTLAQIEELLGVPDKANSSS
jgi:type VI secretion system protein ImpA